MIDIKLKVRNLTKREMTKYLIPLMVTHNPKIKKAQLEASLKDMLKQKYACVGAFMYGNCVGVAGYWAGTRFWCGRYIDVDNVYVLEEYRKKNIGKALMDFIEVYARKQKANMIVLDSYVTSTKAHKFYFREGYTIAGYHFFKKI